MAPTMILAAAFAATVACTVQAVSELHVVTTPASGEIDSLFDPSAGPLEQTAVAGVVASALGVQPPSEFQWDGLYAGNPFNRPRATATIIVEGLKTLDSDMSFVINSVSTDRASSMRSLVTGFADEGFPSIASIVSEKFGGESLSVSVSACSTAAKRSSTRDLDTTSQQHTVASKDGVFVDDATNAKPFQMTAFSGFDGAQYDAGRDVLTYDYVDFSGDDIKLFKELAAMVNVASQLPASDKTPAVLTFTVVSYKHVAARHGESDKTTAAHAAVTKAVSLISAAIAARYNNQALVLAVALETAVRPVEHMEHWIVDHHVKRGRRSAATKYGMALAAEDDKKFSSWNNTNLTRQEPTCTDFKCSCFRPYFGEANGMANDGTYSYTTSAGTTVTKLLSEVTWLAKAKTSTIGKVGCLPDQEKDGNAFVQTTCLANPADATTKFQCSQICVSNQKYCPCQTMTNEERNAHLYPVAFYKYECTKCKAGLFCTSGACYAAGNEFAAVNIVLWIGLPAIAAVCGMWWVLHNIGTPLYSALPDADDMDMKKSS